MISMIKLNNLILFCCVMFVVSCNGQNIANTQTNRINTDLKIGKLVKELSSNLWYIYQDKKNNYWFGSNGQGIYLYDGKTIVNFTTNDGLCNDTIRQIQEDNLGNIYFSTLGGINKFDGFKITTLHPIKSTNWQLEPNDLWFNILGKKNENGPYRYDGENLYQLEFPKHFMHDEIFARGINPFFSPYEVYCIYKDRKGHMWFGTSVMGACLFDGKNIRWMYEYDLTIAPSGGTFGIRSIFEDQKGDFWICNTQHRYHFDFKKSIEADRLRYLKEKGIGDSTIFGGDAYIYFSYIVEDKHHNIWLTTWDKGVYKYDGKDITNYTPKDNLKDVNLVSMYQDNHGDLWLGTLENGVFKYNGYAFEKFEPK